MQISGRNFLPELCGEVQPEIALSKLCAVPFALHNTTLFEEETGRTCAERRGGRGVARKGAKREEGRVKTGLFLCVSLCYRLLWFSSLVRDREGTTKNLCDKDVAEHLGELSSAIRLKILVLVEHALELFR